MLPRAVKTLANAKGFELRRASRGDLYWMIDRHTGLPELNPKGNALFFSLDGAILYLTTMRDRAMAA